MPPLRLTIIVATTSTNGIGLSGTLPWRLPKELKYFAQATTSAPPGTQNAVIMGRNTWESIPGKFRPLKGRVNVVVSKRGVEFGTQENASSPSLTAISLEHAFAQLKNPALPKPVHRAFIIGGAQLYTETLKLTAPSDANKEAQPYVDRILLTRVMEPEFECDVFMPDFLAPSSSTSNNTSDNTEQNEGGQGKSGWKQSTHVALEEWVGAKVAEGVQEENGVRYEFQMWVRD